MPLFNSLDTANLFSKLTVPRVINAWKVLSSYYYSRWTNRAIQRGLPVSISIEPTTSCNLRCPECVSGLRSFTRETGQLQEEFFRKIIDQLHKSLWYLTFYFQGEPYLHPKFTEMVKYASEKNIYVSTSTNAHFLNDTNARKTVESGLHRLIISIDGTTQDTYQSYRKGGKLGKVIAGTTNVVEWKRKLKKQIPHIIFQFLVFRHNEHQMQAVRALAQKIGVNEVRFKTAQIEDYATGSELIPLNEEFSRYQKQSDGHYWIKNKLLNHCWKLWHSCVITWDGNVVPCCFDKDANHRLGDLQKSSFKEIWQGEAYHEFRSHLLQSRKEVDICANCSEGTSVWV